MGALLNLSLEFHREECFRCGTLFWMADSVHRRAKQKGETFWCPNGHGQVYCETEVAKLQKQLEQQKKRTEWAEGEAERQRERVEQRDRSLAAQRGANTKLRNRIANGACPCCKRNFANLQRHMKTQHPEFALPRED